MIGGRPLFAYWLVLIGAMSGCHQGVLRGDVSGPDAELSASDPDGGSEETPEAAVPDPAPEQDAAPEHDAASAPDAASPAARALCGETIEPPSAGGGQGPSVSILFPSSRSYTDAKMLTIRGQSRDPDGVSSVSVNGTSAVSTDGFATWTARVPLDLGCTSLQVTATDRLGHEHSNAAFALVRNDGPLLLAVAALELDTRRNRLIAVGGGSAILGVDLKDGRTSSLADPVRGSGAKFVSGDVLAIDAALDRALTASLGSDGVIAMNLESGSRSVVVPEGLERSLDIKAKAAMALDDAGLTLFVLTRNPAKVIAIDLRTGARRWLAGDGVGAGPSLEGASDMVYNAITSPAVPRLLVSMPAAGSILAVDPKSGDRTVFAGPEASPVHPGRMRVDPKQRRLLVVDGDAAASRAGGEPRARHALVTIDLATGARTTLASSSVGHGHSLEHLYALAFDPEAQRAYVAGSGDGQITSVDVKTGERKLLASSSVGAGDRMLAPAGVALSPEALWLTDTQRNALVRVDRSTGDRREFSGALAGSGPLLESPAAIALDGPAEQPTRALILGTANRSLWAVDLRTGDRRIVSSMAAQSNGAGEAPGLAIDAAGGRILFTETLDASQLNAVDLTTGTRSVVSGSSRGAGPPLSGVKGVLIDATARRALLLSTTTVFAVDLLSGDRSIVSSTDPISWGAVQGVLDAERGRIIAIATTQGVVTIDLTTGEFKQLVGVGDTEGGPLVSPSHITADLKKQLAYVVDRYTRRITLVDLLTGERVILSR